MTTVVARCSKCNRAAKIKCFVDRKKIHYFLPPFNDNKIFYAFEGFAILEAIA